jgi:hypothetical protein
MRTIIFALAATLPVFGAAHAQDFFSTLQFPEGKTISSPHHYGDAAPRSAIVDPKRSTDFSSAAPMAANPQHGKISSRYVYGDAQLSAPTQGTVSGFGYRSGAPMRAHGPSELGVSPRILDGSN